MSLITKMFGSHSEHEVKRIMPQIKKIEALRPEMEALSDEDLRAKTDEFKDRLSKGETLDDILPEAFATVREGAKRALGMEPFEVQLIGGIILHQGRIAEMKTGEGKTLVATLPAYLNALEGKGVHIVTVNDYLANRDKEWMGKVYEFLGLTVGVVLNDMSPAERQEAYNCDITYITNNELGFDYLRDNMVVYEKDQVQRGLHFAIIDEVDSILIDEARTPLIISGQSGKSTDIYKQCDMLAKRMKRGADLPEYTRIDAIMGVEQEETGDFIVNEKDKVVSLTQAGVKKVENYFHLNNLADADNLEIQHCMILALRANNLMHKDKDYVVKDNEVLIVDTFTGRIMPGRRYSDGLHQAIEAKEGVEVKRESKTLATITFQNFFNKYDKKSGMTGTALTEEQEFRDIYGMDVVEIPTNKPVIRVDHEDAVYKTKREKYQAVVEEVKKSHEKGQPVLVGTTTIDASEEVAKALEKEGFRKREKVDDPGDFYVLNAKYHEMEAGIVSHAGEHGAITIATNMAGRGTDIKIDDKAREAGGLRIIGTERHESRRIDNQLRGRSGRQGDPGESQFFISLEDDLMRLFGSERLIKVFESLGVPEGQQIQHKMLSTAIRKAQEKIESNNFATRKNLLEYDRVMNEQRELIYEQRGRILKGENMKDQILAMIKDQVVQTVSTVCSGDMEKDEWDLPELNRVVTEVIPLKPITKEALSDVKTVSDLEDKLYDEAVELYSEKEKEAPEPEMFREVERVILLRVVDSKWMNEIDDMEQLKQGIGLTAYGQMNPIDEYKRISYDMMDAMNESIKHDTVQMLYRVRLEQKVEREEVAKVTGTNRQDEGTKKKPIVRKKKKIMPNDPCPCGSGKKYKYCHGRFNKD